MIKRLLAEYIGTFVLAFSVLLSLSANGPLPTPVLAALVLGLFVYTIGTISGCHLNPGVTIGLWSLKKIDSPDAVKYVAIQFLAGITAFLLAIAIGAANQTAPPATAQALLFELIGTAVFTFGIAAVVYKHVPESVSGLVIGGSLLLGITVAILGKAGGILNPAVAASLGITNIGYYLTEIAGAIVGFQLYAFLLGKKKK